MVAVIRSHHSNRITFVCNEPINLTPDTVLLLQSHTHHSTFEEAQPLESPPAIPSSISPNNCAKSRGCRPIGRHRQISIARQSESPPVTPSTSMTSRMESLRSSPNTSTLPLTTLLSRSTNIPTKIPTKTGDDIITLHM